MKTNNKPIYFFLAILLVGVAYLFTKQINIDNSTTTTIANPVYVPVQAENSNFVTAVPEITLTPYPTQETIILVAPATWTAEPVNLPTPLPPSTGLYAIILNHGETAVTECMAAMATGELLTLECLTIKSQLELINR